MVDVIGDSGRCYCKFSLANCKIPNVKGLAKLLWDHIKFMQILVKHKRSEHYKFSIIAYELLCKWYFCYKVVMLFYSKHNKHNVPCHKCSAINILVNYSKIQFPIIIRPKQWLTIKSIKHILTTKWNIEKICFNYHNNQME